MGYEAGSRYNPGEAEAMAELGEVEGEISGLRSGFSVRWNGNSPMTGHNGQKCMRLLPWSAQPRARRLDDSGKIL